MSKVVIATTVNDVHAAAVAVALKQLGHDAVRWVSSDFPMAQELSLSYDGPTNIEATGTELGFTLDLHDEHFVFWNRRVFSEPFGLPELRASDRGVAANESKQFRDSMLALLNCAHVRVNDVYRARQAENKGLQLHLARHCGLEIPRTVITNSADKIRAFVSTKSKVIAKPFRPTMWRTSEHDLVSYSACVTPEDLPSDDLLRACPMIFQEYVEKAFEVRLTYFGERSVAVRLDSQRCPESKVDWRTVSPARLSVDHISLPAVVESSVDSLMKCLDLRFGCIDMIVTPQGRWLFLEVNQMGQFLWIEEANRNVSLLEPFARFLAGDRPNNVHNKRVLEFDKVMDDAYNLLTSEAPRRVPRPSNNGIADD